MATDTRVSVYIQLSNIKRDIAIHRPVGGVGEHSRVRLSVTLWTVARQVPLSMGFSRQEYWSGLSCPSPGDLPDPGMEPASPVSPALQAYSLSTEPLGKPPPPDPYICTNTYRITITLLSTKQIYRHKTDRPRCTYILQGEKRDTYIGMRQPIDLQQPHLLNHP